MDPLLPTAGLGLGLPNLEPGLADRMQMKQAVQDSEQTQLEQLAEESHRLELERVMKESKRTARVETMRTVDSWGVKKALALGDLEDGFELEQAALLKSMESWRDTEGGRKLPWKSSSNGKSVLGKSSVRDRRSSMHRNSPGVDGLASDIAASLETSATSTASMQEAEESSSSSYRTSLPIPQASAGGVLCPTEEEAIPDYLKQSGDEYPQTVQELVMNGFELSKVLRAYELIGDNFDDLLAFLISSNDT